MQTITLNDKVFEEFIPEEKVLARIQELARQLDEDYADKEPLVLPVLNGAFVFAADLVRAMTLPTSIQFVRLSTYGDEMSSSKNVQSAFGLNIKAKDRHILILEDIIDTGFTSRFLREFFLNQEPASIRIATLLFKPDTFKGQEPPEYVGFEIPEQFVVGYGMDYAQQGRQLKSIYRLQPPS